jgi:hypothetical protein
MTESRHSKYVLTELRQDSRDASLPPGVDPAVVSNTRSHRKMLSLDNMVLEGSFYVESVWIWPGSADVYPETAEPNSHAHDYDETVAFFGTDSSDPYDLGGEIEFWMEDERMVLTRSCLIFVPKGMYHCPLVILRVDRPIFHFAAGTGHAYMQEIAGK